MHLAEYLPQLLLAWSIQAMGILSPGPSVALILGVATSRGRLPSVVTAFGVACGSIVLAVATVVGVTAILAQVAELMTVLRFAGAAYLAWLALKAFRNAASTPKLVVDRIGRESAWRTGLAGFVLQISNPKAIMFWLVIASVGGVGEAPLPVVALFVVIALGFEICSTKPESPVRQTLSCPTFPTTSFGVEAALRNAFQASQAR